MDCVLVPLAHLVPTEETDLDRVVGLEGRIARDAVWTVPVAVHRDALFVMDGHHRLAVARRLHLAMLPAVLLSYDTVRVESWRAGETVTPADIIAMARNGRRFPYKTTRHLFDPPLPSCRVPLQDLAAAVPVRAVMHGPAGAASRSEF